MLVLMIKLNKDGFYILLFGGDLLEWNLLQLGSKCGQMYHFE